MVTFSDNDSEWLSELYESHDNDFEMEQTVFCTLESSDMPGFGAVVYRQSVS